MLINFITGLAWTFGILSTIIVILCFIGAFTYNGSVNEMIDKLQGTRRTWDATKPLIIAIVCWVWIFTI